MLSPGATGKPVCGYEAKIVDDDMNEVPRRHGRQAGGARADRLPLSRRRAGRPNYVRDGWNLTGDTFVQRRGRLSSISSPASDDMIVSSGYNIAGPEVGAALHSRHGRYAVVAPPTQSAAKSSRLYRTQANDLAAVEASNCRTIKATSRL